jgi:adenylylsulfate kinase
MLRVWTFRSIRISAFPFASPENSSCRNNAGLYVEVMLLRTPAAGAGSIVTLVCERNAKQTPVSIEAWADGEHQGLTVWFTGLSGAGKTTICNSVHAELVRRGYRAEMLDADVIRKHLWPDLGFSKVDRVENIRRIGFLAHLFTRNGIIALVAAISPYRAARNEVRNAIGCFLEVFVDAPIEVCEQRDPKGLYKRARAGELPGFTGIDDLYEAPLAADVRCATERDTVKMCSDQVIWAVTKWLGQY